MPIYAYRCEHGHEFETLQRIADEPVERCECGAPTHRVLSAPTIIFRGSGFHNTDYGTRKRPQAVSGIMSNNDKLLERTPRQRRGAWLPPEGIDPCSPAGRVELEELRQRLPADVIAQDTDPCKAKLILEAEGVGVLVIRHEERPEVSIRLARPHKTDVEELTSTTFWGDLATTEPDHETLNDLVMRASDLTLRLAELRAAGWHLKPHDNNKALVINPFTRHVALTINCALHSDDIAKEIKNIDRLGDPREDPDAGRMIELSELSGPLAAASEQTAGRLIARLAPELEDTEPVLERYRSLTAENPRLPFTEATRRALSDDADEPDGVDAQLAPGS